MLTITQIEDALAKLPRYAEVSRDSALEFQKPATIIAALYSANFWKLKTFTGYPDKVIAHTIQALEQNDVIRDDKVTESFARARTGAIELIDRILAKTEAVAPQVSDAPPAKVKNKSAAVRDVVRFLCQTDSPFGQAEIVAQLAAQGITDIGGGAISNEVWVLAKKGEIVCIEKGGFGKAAKYVKGTPAPVVVKPATFKSEKPRTATETIRAAIQAVAARGQSFGWPDVATYLRLEGLPAVEDLKGSFNNTARRMAVAGELTLVQQGNKGGSDPKRNLYALPTSAEVSEAATGKIVEQVEEVVRLAGVISEQMCEAPVANVRDEFVFPESASKYDPRDAQPMTDLNVLPRYRFSPGRGPGMRAFVEDNPEFFPIDSAGELHGDAGCEPSQEFLNGMPEETAIPSVLSLKELQILHDERLADAQAIRRVLQMHGWEVA